MSQIIIGFCTEGTTDVRLLESILQRTFISIADECDRQIEVISPVIKIDKIHGHDFIPQTYECAKQAFKKGVMAFCVHIDADTNSDENVLKNKIQPLFDYIKQQNEDDLCKNIVAIVPVQMSESWMLADKQLLKDEIGTLKSDVELGIHKNPENYSNPKETIENAIRIARQDMVKRRRHDLKIFELYQPIGQKIELKKLDLLSSYSKFKEEVRNAYRALNYLQ